jgi:hypothetical protein
MLMRARKQLLRWERILSKETAAGHGDADTVNRCVERLLKEDPELQAYQSMTPSVQERERALMTNSIQGFMGYFRTRHLPGNASS